MGWVGSRSRAEDPAPRGRGATWRAARGRGGSRWRLEKLGPVGRRGLVQDSDRSASRWMGHECDRRRPRGCDVARTGNIASDALKFPCVGYLVTASIVTCGGLSSERGLKYWRGMARYRG